MIHFQNEISINKPIGEVFPFVADLENVPLWNYYVTRVSKRTDGDVRAGAEYHQIRKTDSQQLRIVEYEINQALTIETIPPSEPELLREMMFQAENGCTHIVDKWQLDTGTVSLLEGLATRRVKGAVLENLTKLKELLETGQTTLQDGRRIQKSAPSN
jgi:uncharacterized membrane protein